MAYFNEDEDDDQQTQGGGVQTASQGATIQAGAGGAAPAGPAGKPDSPGNFVGIKQYIDANKNQAAKLGDQTAGVINQSADQARQGLNTLNQAADSAIKPVASLDPTIMGKIGTTAEALTADERALAKKTAAAKYEGPKAATDLGDVYSNAQKATQTAAGNITNSGTEQGRMNLISQVNSKPRTQGMNVFDNTLLQAGGGREKLAQASTANQDVVGGLDKAAEEIAGKIGRADDPTTPDINEATGAIGQSAKAQADTYKTIHDAMTNWKNGFNPKVSQAQQSLVDQQNRITQDIGDDQFNLNADILEAFGLQNGQHVYDTDLETYLNDVSPNDINAANVASAEDYARYAALADLSGEGDLLLNPNDVSKAGTAPKSKIDTARLAEDLSAKDKAYQTKYKKEVIPLIGNGAPWSSATPEEIENVWIPFFRRIDGADSFLREEPARRVLDAWKNKNYANKIVNPGKNQTTPIKGVHSKAGQ